MKTLLLYVTTVLCLSAQVGQLGIVATKAPTSGGTLITKIAEGFGQSPLGTTSPAVATLNCSGANFAIIAVTNDTTTAGVTVVSTHVITANWTFVNNSPVGGGQAVGLWYTYNASLTNSEVFTVTGSYASAFVQCYSNVLSSGDPIDGQDVKDCGTGTTCFAANATVTPTQNGDVCVAGLLGSATTLTPVTIDSSFSTPVAASLQSGQAYGGAIADLIETTASAINPQFTVNASSNLAGALACFKKTP